MTKYDHTEIVVGRKEQTWKWIHPMTTQTKIFILPYLLILSNYVYVEAIEKHHSVI